MILNQIYLVSKFRMDIDYFCEICGLGKETSLYTHIRRKNKDYTYKNTKIDLCSLVG